RPQRRLPSQRAELGSTFLCALCALCALCVFAVNRFRCRTATCHTKKGGTSASLRFLAHSQAREALACSAIFANAALSCTARWARTFLCRARAVTPRLTLGMVRSFPR